MTTKSALKIVLLLALVIHYGTMFANLFESFNAVVIAGWSFWIIGGVIAMKSFRYKGRMFFIMATGLGVILYMLQTITITKVGQ